MGLHNKKLLSIASIVLCVSMLSGCASQNKNPPAESHDATAVVDTTTEIQQNNTSQEITFENFCDFGLLNSSSVPGFASIDLQYREDYPPDHIWLIATEKDTVEENDPQKQYIAIDLDGTYTGSIDTESYSIISPFFDGIACVFNNETKKRELLNTKMENVTSDYISSNEGEELIQINSDKTGTTIWTRKTTDTYDSHVSELFAKDLSGTVKASWTSKDDNMKDIDNIQFIEFISDAFYTYCSYDKYALLNVENNNVVRIGELHSGIELKSVFDDGSYLTSVGSNNYRGLCWYSSTGEQIKEIQMYGKIANSSYGGGLMYISGEIDNTPYKGFVNQQGSPVITLDATLNITNLPIYRGDYALIELENDGGQKFVTLLDKNGKFAFEPIKGEIYRDLMDRTYRGVLEGHQFYIEQDGGFYYLQPNGDTEKIDFDFENSQGLLGKIYITSEDHFEVI